MKKVTKAVFPVAGLGTRFLPATKASAKEMMPVMDKPLIQYAVEEAYGAGIRSMVFINGRNKRAIEDHFDNAPELEQELRNKGKTEVLQRVREIIPEHMSCIYLRQAAPLGLGNAVLCAEPTVDDEPFAVLLADDLFETGSDAGNCVADLISIHEEYDASVVAVEEVGREDVGKYGIVSGEEIKERMWRVNSLVEKPAPESTVGNLAVMGRYVLKPEIFDLLRNIPRGVGGEIQLTDAINEAVKCGKVMAYRYRGRRHDCGNKLGYLMANVETALRDPHLGEAFRDYLRKLKV